MGSAGVLIDTLPRFSSSNLILSSRKSLLDDFLKEFSVGKIRGNTHAHICFVGNTNSTRQMDPHFHGLQHDPGAQALSLVCLGLRGARFGHVVFLVRACLRHFEIQKDTKVSFIQGYSPPCNIQSLPTIRLHCPNNFPPNSCCNQNEPILSVLTAMVAVRQTYDVLFM